MTIITSRTLYLPYRIGIGQGIGRSPSWNLSKDGLALRRMVAMAQSKLCSL